MICRQQLSNHFGTQVDLDEKKEQLEPNALKLAQKLALTDGLIDSYEGLCGVPIITTAQYGFMILVEAAFETHSSLVQRWEGYANNHHCTSTVVKKVHPF